MELVADEFSIAIIGSGPMCVYAMERLAALVPSSTPGSRVRISVFERTGRFGSGDTYRTDQPDTNHMNRIAGQIALGADSTVVSNAELLPDRARVEFLEWAASRYAATGDPRFLLSPTDVPKRSVHGEALEFAFMSYVSWLRRSGSVAVDLYHREVTDVVGRPAHAQYGIYVKGMAGPLVKANAVLFVTGHSQNEAAFDGLDPAGAEARPVIPYAYPLERNVGEDSVPPGAVVGISGLGLTAIDVMLYLTEGRGGRFIRRRRSRGEAWLGYIPSGREPKRIVAYSPGGSFVSSRPYNAKQGKPRQEHHAIAFTQEAIAELRNRCGTTMSLASGRVIRQLSFERHVLPLLVLEMEYVYYGVLLGTRFKDLVQEATRARYLGFLRDPEAHAEDGADYLLFPGDGCFGEAADYLARIAEHRSVGGDLRRFDEMGVLEAFEAFLYGAGELDASVPVRRLGEPSPWGHSPDIRDHRFYWREVLDPVTAEGFISGRDWASKVVDYMRSDLANAHQGNVANPIKACCDGVWRDLRAELSAAVDWGGLTAEAHRSFDHRYMRYYNRLSNGAGSAASEKVLSLVEAGLVDVSSGPDPTIERSEEDGRLHIVGSITDADSAVDVLIQARLHRFLPEVDINPLYRNLLDAGVIRRWVNPGGAGGRDYYPGGLDLDARNHPYSREGVVDPRLTFVGAPSEGVAYFQMSIARPNADSYILRNLACWADELTSTIMAS